MFFNFLSIEALSDALSSWGKKDGAIIVVSHDRSFCESVGFNTVGTVSDGSLTVQERDLNDSDWKQYDMRLSSLNGAASSGSTEEGTPTREMTPEEKAEDKKRRRMAYNAPKTIAKLEKKIESAEMRIAEIDEEMMAVGNDVGKLMDLTKEKEKEEEKVIEMMAEWEELEELLAQVS